MSLNDKMFRTIYIEGQAVIEEVYIRCRGPGKHVVMSADPKFVERVRARILADRAERDANSLPMMD